MRKFDVSKIIVTDGYGSTAQPISSLTEPLLCPSDVCPACSGGCFIGKRGTASHWFDGAKRGFSLELSGKISCDIWAYRINGYLRVLDGNDTRDAL